MPKIAPPVGWLYQRNMPVEPLAVMVAPCPHVAEELTTFGTGHCAESVGTLTKLQKAEPKKRDAPARRSNLIMKHNLRVVNKCTKSMSMLKYAFNFCEDKTF